MKSAHDGFPRSLAPTLSAFANRPGGRLLVLGVPVILTALENGPASLPGLAERTDLTAAQLHYALRGLQRRGLVALDRGRGQRESTYRSLQTT